MTINVSGETLGFGLTRMTCWSVFLCRSDGFLFRVSYPSKEFRRALDDWGVRLWEFDEDGIGVVVLRESEGRVLDDLTQELVVPEDACGVGCLLLLNPNQYLTGEPEWIPISRIVISQEPGEGIVATAVDLESCSAVVPGPVCVKS